MPASSSSIVWLCTWSRGPAPGFVYLAAPSAGDARRELLRRGLPSSATVERAGYSTTAPPAASSAPAKPRRPAERVRPRARAALRLLAAIRADWPIPSILERPRYSDAVLLDFVGNMALALGRLEPELRRQVERLVDLEARAAFHRALELNARRAGDRQAAAELRDLASGFATSARRLAKRKAIRQAVADVDAALAGELEVLASAADWFEAWLRGNGYSEEEAERFTAAWRRVLVPRL